VLGAAIGGRAAAAWPDDRRPIGEVNASEWEVPSIANRPYTREPQKQLSWLRSGPQSAASANWLCRVVLPDAAGTLDRSRVDNSR
jgi:hypothetical protein